MAEDHEWVEADVTLDNKEIPERANALLDRLGFSEEDKRNTEAFAGDNPFSDVVRLMAEEAQAIGGPTFDEVKDLLKWYSYLDEKGKTSKSGPLTLSRTVRRQVQRRLQKGSGRRRALLAILFFDCIARAYYEVAGE